MKKIYFLLMMALATATAWSQKIWDGPGTGGSWNDASNWLPTGVPVDGDTVLISGVSGTITNVAAAGDVMLRGLRIEGASLVTLSALINRTITIDDEFGSEDFYIEGGSSLTLGGGATGVNIALRDPYWVEALIAGTLVVSAGRTYNSDHQDTDGRKGTRVTGTIDNSGTVIGNPEALEFQDGGTYIHSRNGGSIPSAAWLPASNCNITGITNAVPSDLGQAFGNFMWNNPNQAGNRSLAPSGMSVAGTLSVVNTGGAAGDRLLMSQENLSVGNLEISGGIFVIGTDVASVPVSRILNVSGNVSITGGVLNTGIYAATGGTGTINVQGNFSLTGGRITESGAGSGKINFTGTAVQNFLKAPAPTAIIAQNIDFTINNEAKVDFGTSILNGSTGLFTLSSGGKIITAHPNGLASNGAIQIDRLFDNSADYEFQGASTGNFVTTNNQVRSLIVNNTTTGEVVASRPFLVNVALTLTNGYLTTTAANLVTITVNGNASTANGAFVNGPLAKNTTTTALFTFPVGKADGGLHTIGVTPVNGTNNTYVAEFFRAAPPAGTPGGGLVRVSSCEYWNLNRTAGNAAGRVTLSWTANSPCNGAYVTDPLSLEVARLVGTTWNNLGSLGITGTVAAGTVTSNNPAAGGTLNSFFALASSSDANPLPVVFGDVKAYQKNNGVQIEWSNLTEKDVAGYTVERSANGSDFSGIGEQLPTSNQNDRADYDAFDATPLQGTNYYRIKAIETTGKIVYSKVLSVNPGQAGKGLKLYPNPVNGNQVTISLSNIKKGQYNLRVVNTAGQDIYKRVISNQGSITTQTIDLPSSIKPGVYNMIITGSDYRENKMFIVQ